MWAQNDKDWSFLCIFLSDSSRRLNFLQIDSKHTYFYTVVSLEGTALYTAHQSVSLSVETQYEEAYFSYTPSDQSKRETSK